MSKEWKKVEMSPVWNGKDEHDKFILKEGDSVEGTFLGVENNVGPNNSNLYSVNTDKGLLSVWGSTVLDIRLKNIKPGEEIKIVYLGLESSQKTKGRQYHNYDVFHRESEIPVVEEDEEDIGEPPF